MEKDIRIENYLTESDLERTLYKGTAAMHTAGTKYLYKHPMESQGAYKLRLQQSILLNAYRKTTQFLAGQVFQKNFMTGTDDNDFDLIINESNPNIFFKDAFSTGLYKGVSIIIVDAPETVASNRQEEIENNIKPYIREIPIEDIISFQSEGNRITQIVIKEAYYENMEFGAELRERFRIIEEDGSYKVIEDNKEYSGKISIGKIPIVIFIPGEQTSAITGVSPLRDLAYLNLHHYQSYSDQINILSVARVPLIFGRNIQVDKMPVGTATMVTSTDENSDLKYVEVQGASISAGRQDVKDTEVSMALYGLQQLAPNTSQVTATERIISNAGTNSSLSSWALDYQDVIQKTYELYGEFIGKEFNGEISINTEYDLGYADPTVINSILTANSQGILSNKNTYDELQKRSIINTTDTYDDNLLELEKDSYQDFTLDNTLFE
jgi:hypothetical protein